ncbi:CBO0543 family protein [Bacillaceae bacterium W0354]
MDIRDLVILIIMIIGGVGCIYFISIDWRRYGLLFIISVLSANLLCFTFTYFGLYSFPYNPLHGGALMPYGLVSTVFPFLVLFSVRYSPKKWVWKIPFYWGVIHLGVTGEVILKSTSIFKFGPKWDLWDSYTLWWIYYLLFELLGGKIIPDSRRKPIDAEAFSYGHWAWIIFHVIVIVTIFLAGVYTGVTIIKK